MLKLLRICLLFFFVSVSAFSQTGNTSESGDLYYKALKIYLEENEKEYSKLFSDRDFSRIIVMKDTFLPKNLPNSIGKYKIEFVDYDEVKKRLKKGNDKTLLVAEFRPLINSENRLVISIAEYQAKYEKKRLSLGLSDGIRITFKFDCETEDFVLDKFEFFGV
jgi:hypothetical protein